MHFLTLLPLLAFSAAAPLNIRAGAPPVKPIPSDCKLEHPHTTSKASAFTLTSAFSSAHAVYTEYLPSYYNTTYSRQVCDEQCYGFGNPGECVSTLWANNVTYTAYGVQNVGVVCNMFGTAIGSKDLVPVTDGSYTTALATNIKCPASCSS